MAEIDDIGYNGIQTKDNNTLVSELTTNFQNIYAQEGEELNLDSNTPDGQIIEIISQLGSAMRELITEVYNSFNPDSCVGAIQDNRYQINYVTRKAGSYTLQNFTITTNKTVELQGLDASYNDPEASAYSLSDNTGTIWYLVDSKTLYAGSTVCEFRAKDKGVIIPTVGTITNQVTVVEGVTNVINNFNPTIIGTEEESDSDFRIRREQALELPSENSIDAIRGQLLNLEGVSAVNTHTNNTNSTDATGTPSHSIWVVVEGGANNEIAQTIYANLGAAGTKGTVAVQLYSASLQPITINFDRATIKPLYIKFNIYPKGDLGEINVNEVKEYIAENLVYEIGEDVETSKVTEVCSNAMLADGNNGYALNVKISSGGSASAISSDAGLTVSVDSVLFQDKFGDDTESYVFTYVGTSWQYDSQDINIAECGISVVGTPAENDTITVNFTGGTWTDFIAATTIADKYTTDINKIYAILPE